MQLTPELITAIFGGLVALVAAAIPLVRAVRGSPPTSDP